MSDKKFISNKTKKPIGAIAFLSVVILLTLGLFFYNSHLDNVNSELLIEIDEIREDQKELSKDEKLQVLALLEENKNSIAELTKRTKVTEYIKHLDATALKYKLTFEGFKMSGGRLSTTATVVADDDGGIAYAKTVNFIKNYETDEIALFKLNFINQIEGMNTMKFNVDFDIK